MTEEEEPSVLISASALKALVDLAVWTNDHSVYAAPVPEDYVDEALSALERYK